MGNNRTDSCTAFKPCTSIQTIVGTVVSPISLMAAVCVPPISTPCRQPCARPSSQVPLVCLSLALVRQTHRHATRQRRLPRRNVQQRCPSAMKKFGRTRRTLKCGKTHLRCRWHGPKTIYNGSHVGCQLLYTSGEPTSPLRCGTTCHRYQVPCSSAHQYLDSMFDCPGHDTAKICVGCAVRGMACVSERI